MVELPEIAALDLGKLNPEAHFLREAMLEPGRQILSIPLGPQLAERLLALDKAATAPWLEGTAATADAIEHIGRRLAETLGLSDRELVAAAKGVQLAPGEREELVRVARADKADPETTGGQSAATTATLDVVVDEKAAALLDQLNRLPADEIQEIVKDILAKQADRGVFLEAASAASDAYRPRTDVPHCSPRSVIIAVIDDGIGIANHRFRSSPKTTRVWHFLDMREGNEDKPPAVPPGGKHVETLGIAWTKVALDKLLADYGDDEAEIYRAMGMIDYRSERRQPLRFRVTHGTHVLDIAAGYDHADSRNKDEREQRPIIAVQLPSASAADASGTRMAATLKLALDWVREKAVELSHDSLGAATEQHLPLVVNFSFGVFAGPHDGFGEIEQRIQQFLKNYRGTPSGSVCEVVIPAGNGFQSRAIARIDELPVEGVTLDLCLQPEDATASFVQIWGPKNAAGGRQQFEVELEPPRGGQGSKSSKLDGDPVDWPRKAQVLARIYHHPVDRGGGETRERVTLAFRSTLAENDSAQFCPAGIWRIHIRNLTDEPVQGIDLRVQRDDAVAFTRPLARQSYFDDPEHERFDPVSGRAARHDCCGYVRRTGTLNAYATGSGPIVVGGYRGSDGSPAGYSGSGPATPEREGPDLGARCEDSPSHPGVLASGTYTGSVAVMNGTSVAAPQVARALADAWARGESTSDFLGALDEGRKGPRSGPHGTFGDLEPRRHGRGRLAPYTPPPHRRRLETEQD